MARTDAQLKPFLKNLYCSNDRFDKLRKELVCLRDFSLGIATLIMSSFVATDV